MHVSLQILKSQLPLILLFGMTVALTFDGKKKVEKKCVRKMCIAWSCDSVTHVISGTSQK